MVCIVVVGIRYGLIRSVDCDKTAGNSRKEPLKAQRKGLEVENRKD